MPRIIVTSDIHLGITSLPRVMQLVSDIRKARPDAVAIAGDIGEGVENIELVLDEFKHLGIPVAACAGNHDVWNHDKKTPSERVWTSMLPKIAKRTDTTWLENENLIVGDVAIVGSTAWYDYSAQDPAFISTPDETWLRKAEFDADAWMCDWPWNDVEFCKMVEPGFRERLKSAQENPDVKKIIVVTHSPIFEEQIKRKPGNFKWGFSNAYYGNLTFGEIVKEFSKVKWAVAGHTHAGMEGSVDVSGRLIRVVTLDSQYNDPIFETIE